MDTKKMLDTVKTINKKNYPKKYEYFAGADLLIVGEAEPNMSEAYVWVVTNYPAELSWLVYQLKEIFWDELDYLNKFAFYPGLGNVMNEGLKNGDSLKEIMLHTVLQALLFWIIPPETRTKEEMVMKMLEEKAGPIPKSEDDGLTIGQILKAIEEGKPIAENRNKAMHEWMKKAMK